MLQEKCHRSGAEKVRAVDFTDPTIADAFFFWRTALRDLRRMLR